MDTTYIGKICPYCKTEIQADDEVQVCPKCGIAHHKGCWDENYGCTTFGCAGNHGQGNANALTCENCGAVMENGQKFCPKCGRPQLRRTQPTADQPQKTCPNCGTPNSAESKFCIRCSTSLISPAATLAASAAPSAATTASVSVAGVPAYTAASATPSRTAAAEPAAAVVGESFPSVRSASVVSVKAEKTRLPKLIAIILGLFSGLLSVIFGIVTYGMGAGSFESSRSYGGDAYTGIQNAAAQSANNIIYASKLLRFGFGSLLLVLGLFLIGFFILKLCKELETQNKAQ